MCSFRGNSNAFFSGCHCVAVTGYCKAAVLTVHIIPPFPATHNKPKALQGLRCPCQAMTRQGMFSGRPHATETGEYNMHATPAMDCNIDATMGRCVVLSNKS